MEKDYKLLLPQFPHLIREFLYLALLFFHGIDENRHKLVVINTPEFFRIILWFIYGFGNNFL